MNQDTIEILQQCNSGCKNATNSMEQVEPYIKDEHLKQLIESYDKKHISLGDECHQMLNAGGVDEKDPSAATKAFSWLGTELKLMTDDSSHKIAELMVDGCNMGIKTISAYRNQYNCASPESDRLAQHLVDTEQAFMKDLLTYL